jgi:hypothetical protein
MKLPAQLCYRERITATLPHLCTIAAASDILAIRRPGQRKLIGASAGSGRRRDRPGYPVIASTAV